MKWEIHCFQFSPTNFAVLQHAVDWYYLQPQHCASLFHLYTDGCAVSDMGSVYLWGYNGPVRRAEINEACFCGWEALMARFCNCTCSFCLILSTPGNVKLSSHLNFTSCMTSAQSWCYNIVLLIVFQYCIVLNTLMSLSLFAKHF